MRGDRGFKFPVCGKLHTEVYGKMQVLSINGRSEKLQVSDRISYPVFEDDFAATFAGQPFVKCKLDTFNALTIEVCQTDDVRGCLTGRIITTVFGLQGYVRQLKARQRLCICITQMPFQVDEFLLSISPQTFVNPWL